MLFIIPPFISRIKRVFIYILQKGMESQSDDLIYLLLSSRPVEALIIKSRPPRY